MGHFQIHKNLRLQMH